jgi:hypothetical protein
MAGTPVTPKRNLIYFEGAEFRAAVSEELIQRQGAVTNFICLNQYTEKTFQGNGFYGRQATPYTVTDGLTFFDKDAEITNVYVYINFPGTGGTTELDLKIAAPGSSTWTSIFSTTPKFTSASPILARVDVRGNNPPVTGVTAPVLASSPMNVDEGYAVRLDILQAMTGDPVTVGALIVYRPR